MSDTLVLDTLGFPVAFVSWQRAVNLQWQDRAVVVTEDAKRILRSPSFEMGMPRVIKLRNHISRKLRLKVPMTRRNIAIRDNSSCQYCGVVLETAEYTIDHVLPRARGGSSVWTNLALACVQCNKRKSDRTPQEAGLTLRQKPRGAQTSSTRDSISGCTSTRLRPEWSDYKAYLYWNVELEK